VALFECLPGTPSLTFARQLRLDRRTADTFIIIIGRPEEQDAIAALDSGADDYVARPFSMRELIARVRAVMRRKAPHLADNFIELSGLTFDSAARRVTAGSRAVVMGNTEFNLLHVLMAHPLRPFSRRQLLDEIWGEQVFVEEQAVDVHVARLRRALAPTHDVLIETVRGIGYRFQAVELVAAAGSRAHRGRTVRLVQFAKTPVENRDVIPRTRIATDESRGRGLD
jgi:two-component system phosphate regulon response regulator PhoB